MIFKQNVSVFAIAGLVMQIQEFSDVSQQQEVTSLNSLSVRKQPYLPLLVLQVLTGPYWSLPVPTKPYQALLGLTGPY